MKTATGGQAGIKKLSRTGKSIAAERNDKNYKKIER